MYCIENQLTKKFNAWFPITDFHAEIATIVLVTMTESHIICMTYYNIIGAYYATL